MSTQDSAQRLAVVYFDPAGPHPVVESAQAYFSKASGIQSAHLTSYAEVAHLLGQAGRGLIIFSITAREESTDLLRILAAAEPWVKRGLVRIFGVNSYVPNRLDKILSERGVCELLNAQVSARALHHKCDQWLRLVEKNWSQSQSHQERSSTAQTMSAQHPGVVMEAALPGRADCWYLERTADVRKVLGKWIIALLGPSPAAGKWEEILPNLWEWRPKPGVQDLLIQEPGVWQFRGRKPEFDWELCRWQLIDESPLLYFRRPTGEVLYRLRITDTEGLQVAANSEHVAGLLPEMRRTLVAEKRVPANRVWSFQSLTPEDVREWGDLLDDLGPHILLVQGAVQVPARLLDFYGSKLYVESPMGEFRAGTKLPVRIEATRRKAKIIRESLATVTDIDKGDESDILGLELSEEARVGFSEFSQLVEERQESVLNFLKAARGY